MSLLPAGALSYAALVSEFFLQLRGSGLLLSPLDQELVAEWERRGIPAAVVCRGMRRGFEELGRDRPAGSAPPRSLRALRGFVEEEWRVYREGRVGDGGAPEPEAEAAARRLAAARAHLAEAAEGADVAARTRTAAAPPDGTPAGTDAAGGAATDAGAMTGRSGRGDAYRDAAARLPATVGTLQELDRALRDADDLLLHRWILSLPRPERSALGPRCRLLAGERTRRARRASYRHALRTHLFEAARRAGILCLHGTV